MANKYIKSIKVGENGRVCQKLASNLVLRHAPFQPVIPMATDPSFKYVINPNREVMRYWQGRGEQETGGVAHSAPPRACSEVAHVLK